MLRGAQAAQQRSSTWEECPTSRQSCPHSRKARLSLTTKRSSGAWSRRPLCSGGIQADARGLPGSGRSSRARGGLSALSSLPVAGEVLGVTRQVVDSSLRTRNPGTGTRRFEKSILRTENPGPGIRSPWTQRSSNLMSPKALRAVSESGPSCSARIGLAQRIEVHNLHRVHAGSTRGSDHESELASASSAGCRFRTANQESRSRDSRFASAGSGERSRPRFCVQGPSRRQPRSLEPESCPQASPAAPQAVEWPIRPGNCRTRLAAKVRGARTHIRIGQSGAESLRRTDDLVHRHGSTATDHNRGLITRRSRSRNHIEQKTCRALDCARDRRPREHLRTQPEDIGGSGQRDFEVAARSGRAQRQDQPWHEQEPAGA